MCVGRCERTIFIRECIMIGYVRECALWLVGWAGGGGRVRKGVSRKGVSGVTRVCIIKVYDLARCVF